MTEIDWHRMPTLAALRAFEATARCGGFSAAARQLNVTHAAVAQQVRALEDVNRYAACLVAYGRVLRLTPRGRKTWGKRSTLASLRCRTGYQR